MLSLRLKPNLELNAFGQAEFWKVPVLASGQQLAPLGKTYLRAEASVRENTLLKGTGFSPYMTSANLMGFSH